MNEILSKVTACQILVKLGLSGQIFEKYSNINFLKIHPLGTDVLHADRRTR